MRAFLVSISIVVTTFAALTMLARAQGVAEGRAQVAELYDAGPVDPVVAADHAIRPVAAPVDPPPAPSKGGASFVDDALAIAGPVGRGEQDGRGEAGAVVEGHASAAGRASPSQSWPTTVTGPQSRNSRLAAIACASPNPGALMRGPA